MKTTKTGNASLIAQLRNIIEQEPNTIRAEVAEEVLDKAEHYSIKSWFNDLLSHGCVCGMVGSLIYYYDTHKFFNDHYEEIEELREEYEESTGETLKIEGRLTNWLAWFAFEQTAWQMASEIGLDI